ncbi:3-phosphoshikimate 1-carboxyvinyltransferase [Actinobacillus equuli]|nr:3-phosphoshikimate 1-carboxyvinyltransferase [Actinobacillus equuli]
MDMNHIPDAAMTIATTALLPKGKRLFAIFITGVSKKQIV